MDRKQKLALFHLTHFRCSGEYNNECNDDFDAGDLRWGEGSLGYGSFYGFFCRGCFEKICIPGLSKLPSGVMVKSLLPTTLTPSLYAYPP